MTLQEFILKVLLFFAVFYGAIAITAFVSKKFNLAKKAEDEAKKEAEQEKKIEEKENSN